MTTSTERMLSKTLWKALLTIATFALVANLINPAGFRLSNLAYWDRPGASSSRQNDTSIPYADTVDWSQFAYCQYVTNEPYLCNSLQVFEALSRLGAKAARLMLYPEEWVVDNTTRTGELLEKAREEYGVRLQPIKVQHFDGEFTWADSFTKLLAFNQTDYKRVLSLDSDSIVLQPMDELFLLPSAPVAMPQAYWLDDTLSSQLVLVEPSAFEFERIQKAFEARTDNEFDMDIVNNIYGDDCLIIPHRRYDLITGEFREKTSGHEKYLGSKEEQWDPDRMLSEAKFLHFSDWPISKPWIPTPLDVIEKYKPDCTVAANGTADCRDQELWFGFYAEFRERPLGVCGKDFDVVNTPSTTISALEISPIMEASASTSPY